MKTLEQVIESSNIPESLITATIKQLGGNEDSLLDVYNHGADAGYSGFTYYHDTVKFFDSNRKAIMSIAGQMADDLGEDCLVMISRFNCLLDGKEPAYTTTEIAQAIYDVESDNADIIKNALAWFSLEEVARAFCDE